MNKEAIISHCRQMDKSDVYEWIAEDEFKIKDLQQRIDKAIEYMKPRFMNCIDNGKRYFEDNDIQEIYEILGGK